MINRLPVGRIVSDTSDRRYTVSTHPGVSGEARFECRADDPNFKHGSSGKAVPCKHAALYARRMERMGYLTWHGGLWWVNSEYLPKVSVPDDPFEWLPQ
jgi:hypothetical protein